jgi:hypothetical protein
MAREFDIDAAHPWMKAAYQWGQQAKGWFEVTVGSEQDRQWYEYFARLGWIPSAVQRAKTYTMPVQLPTWLPVEADQWFKPAVHSFFYKNFIPWEERVLANIMSTVVPSCGPGEMNGLGEADSHKTYSGTKLSLNSFSNPNETDSVGFKTLSGCAIPKTTPEQRVAHVERLRAEGRLSFDSGAEAERRKPWFERLTTQQANETLARYAAEAAPSVPSPTLLGEVTEELSPVPF